MKPPLLLLFLIDACKISLKALLSREFAIDPKAFADHLNLEIREVKQSFKRKKNRNFPFMTFDVGTFGGLSVYASQDRHGSWYLRNLRINPGKLIYGHNGRILTSVEFGIALSVVIDLLRPFLESPDDAEKLIPGLPDSEAFWSSIEILFHTSGKYLDLFLNARHPWIRTPAQRYEGESIKLGKVRSDLNLNIYRKDLEMIAKKDPEDVLHYSGGATKEDGVLRVEVRLKGELLLNLLGGRGRTSFIEKKHRLTNFTAETFQRAHKAVVSNLQGCFLSVTPGGPDNDKLGRFMAIVSAHTGQPIDFWLDQYKSRFNSSEDFEVRHRSAAVDEASRLSTVSLADIFSDEAYASQPGLSFPAKELFGKHRRENTPVHPGIAKAYDIPLSPPTKRRFIPHTTLDV